MNSICNGYCGRLCLGGNFTECGACPWGWMMNHSDYYLVQPDYYLAQPQICYPCENTFDSYDWLFIIFNFGMLYMLHAQAILRFSGINLSKQEKFQGEGLERPLSSPSTVHVRPDSSKTMKIKYNF